MDVGNIYAPYRQGENWVQIPFIPIPDQGTDKQETYIPGVSLLTRISMKFYGIPYMGKLILAANPAIIDEFAIEDEVVLRIPFPLESSLQLLRQSAADYLND